MTDEPPYKTKREPLVAYPFTTSVGWPKAESSAVSIFEAICITGRAKFGDDWTGNELLSLSWLVSPQAAYDSWRVSLAGIRHLAGVHRIPRYGLPPKTPAKTISGPDSHVRAYRKAQAERFVEKEEREFVANQKSCARLFATVEWLAQRCRDRELQSYTRPSGVGALTKMLPMEWNLENAFARYVSKGTFERYFPEFQQTWSAYVFFDRDSLQRLVAGLAHAPLSVSELDLRSLSPYLQLAVRIALSKDYTSREKAESQPIREAEVRAAWADAMPPNIPESGNAVMAIAKVIGFPDAAAIAQGKSKKRVLPAK